MLSRIDACEYDLNIRCVNDTGCRECIHSENESAGKWVHYVHKDIHFINELDTPAIELEK